MAAVRFDLGAWLLPGMQILIDISGAEFIFPKKVLFLFPMIGSQFRLPFAAAENKAKLVNCAVNAAFFTG